MGGTVTAQVNVNSGVIRTIAPDRSYANTMVKLYLKQAEVTSLRAATLLVLEAKAVDSANRVDWATASEENTAGFEVERSEDASTFKAIGSLTAKGCGAAYLSPADDRYWRCL